ncbi:hypothetical protein [Paraferrimonas haliotis]|uniref:hypothetical protein n=1 Tax=Paraferrimonas haliotis TaxID=2013866 RepID=UPI000BA928FE|nr:hypothetical protein [Paraferrimonas haliotis]
MSSPSKQGSAGNVIAAIASFFIPGLGQLVQGRLLSAILFAVIAFGGYALYWMLFIPAIIGFIAHVWSIIDAARYKG